MKAFISFLIIGLLVGCASHSPVQSPQKKAQISGDNGAMLISPPDQSTFPVDQGSQSSPTAITSKMISPFTK